MNNKPIKSPFVSIIIPSYNSGNYIRRCLEKLLDQSYPPDKYEIIVVDNGSTDNSPQIIKEFPVKYLIEKKKGPSAARNKGIDIARGEYLICIDTDCLADRNLIREHINIHQNLADKSIKVVGGSIDGINDNYWALCDHFCSWSKNHPGLKPRDEKRFLPTANISFEKKLLQELNFPFNVNLITGEDVDFCKRIRAKGYKLHFNPRPKVSHINRSTFTAFMKHAKQWASTTDISKQASLDGSDISIKNPLLSLLYALLNFIASNISLALSWLTAGKVSFIAALPMVIINRIYFGYNLLKSRVGK